MHKVRSEDANKVRQEKVAATLGPAEPEIAHVTSESDSANCGNLWEAGVLGH